MKRSTPTVDSPRTGLHAMRQLRNRQSGSAYIAALLVLVVLTILGLSLNFVTQTELQVGANERSVNRVFYGADAGVGVGIALALTGLGDSPCGPQNFALPHSSTADADSAVNRAFRIATTHFVPLEYSPCGYCSANENEQNFFRVNNTLTSTAEDVIWITNVETPPDDARVQGQKAISTMVQVQPFWEPLPKCVPEPDEAVDIRL